MLNMSNKLAKREGNPKRVQAHLSELNLKQGMLNKRTKSIN